MRKPQTVQWRKNVLLLVGFGYALVLIVFITLIAGTDMSVDGAYDIISGPVMALIGGSLAIAKDLIGADESEEQRLNNGSNGESGETSHGDANPQDGE